VPALADHQKERAGRRASGNRGALTTDGGPDANRRGGTGQM
jgi:hypothetical protein